MRGQFVTTSIDGSEEYNLAWDSDLGSKMNGWYVEASYNLFSLENEEKLDLFARYSNYDTHAGVAGSLVANEAYNRNVLTTGLVGMLHQVLLSKWTIRSLEMKRLMKTHQY